MQRQAARGGAALRRRAAPRSVCSLSRRVSSTSASGMVHRYQMNRYGFYRALIELKCPACGDVAKAPRTRTGRRTDTATHANTSSILNVTASSETAVPRPRSLRSGLSAASALTLLPYRLRLYVPNRIHVSCSYNSKTGVAPVRCPPAGRHPSRRLGQMELRSAGRSPDGPAVGTGPRRARTAMQARPRRASRA